MHYIIHVWHMVIKVNTFPSVDDITKILSISVTINLPLTLYRQQQVDFHSTLVLLSVVWAMLKVIYGWHRLVDFLQCYWLTTQCHAHCAYPSESVIQGSEWDGSNNSAGNKTNIGLRKLSCFPFPDPQSSIKWSRAFWVTSLFFLKSW
jgi:hypothetical protein